MSMWLPLAIGIGVLIFAIAYQLIESFHLRRPQQPMPPDVIKWGVPVNDPDSAIGAGWFVEVDGLRVAELTEPRCQPDGWLSYVIVPLTDDPKMKKELFDLKFWHSERPAYRSRKFEVLALGVLISGVPPCPETHRIILKGPYIHLDPGPSLVERFVGLFKRRKCHV